jgi:hypothetical protein
MSKRRDDIFKQSRFFTVQDAVRERHAYDAMLEEKARKRQIKELEGRLKLALKHGWEHIAARTQARLEKLKAA